MKKIFVALSMVALLAACSGEGGNSTNPSDDESATLSSADGQGSSSSEKNVTNSSSSRCEECNDDAISSSGNAESSCSEELSESSSSSAGKAKSSSSVVTLANPCKTETEDNCEYGELTDDRDGQTYKTVKIGDQWWMAQNLNYAYLEPTADEDSSSFCFKNDDRFCVDYGRLYLWSAAMDSTGIWSANVKERGVCPDGWHLPSEAEWDALFKAVGGGGTAALVLKSTSGWYNGGNGTDVFGFSVLPADYRTAEKDYYYDVGERAYFWSSSERYNRAVVQFFAYDFDYVQTAGVDKDRAYSVRCLKD